MFVSTFLLMMNTVQGALLLKGVKTINVTFGEPFSFYCSGYKDEFWGKINLRRNDVTLLIISQCSRFTDDIPRYNLECKESPYVPCIMLKVEIPAENMTEDEHRSEWRCELHSFFHYPFTEMHIQRIVLNVQVPLQEVSITNSPDNFISITEMSELKCEARNSRPAAYIDWYIDGEKVENKSLITYTVSGNDTERYTTRSTLKLLGNVTKRYQKIHCEGQNIYGRKPVKSENVTVEVLYHPGESPTIQGYTNGFRLLSTDPPLTLTCRIRKTWPHPSLHWACPHLSEILPLSYTTEHVVSKVKIDVSTDLDGQTCTCIATHSVDDFNRKTSVKFVVLAKSSIDNRTGEITLGIGVTLLLISSTTIVLLIVRRTFRCRMQRKDLSESRDSSISVRGIREHPLTTIADNVSSEYETVNGTHNPENIEEYTSLPSRSSQEQRAGQQMKSYENTALG